MLWSAQLHFVGGKEDNPPKSCTEFPGTAGWNGEKDINVLAGVRNVTTLIDGWNTGNGVSHDAAEEALKFLVHFLGDMHMPFHLTGLHRGGNQAKVLWGGVETSRLLFLF